MLYIASLSSGRRKPGVPLSPREMMEADSWWVIEEALKKNEWNQTRAAEEFGLQRTYFTKLLRQKQICGKPPKSSSSSAPDKNPDHT